MHNEWVLRKKRGKNGDVDKYKARLVKCGNEDQSVQEETFAPVVDFNIVRLCLAIAGQKGYFVEQMDFQSAFLQAKIERDVYMELPKFLNGDRKTKVCKLKKSLYGLKEAPRLWFKRTRRTFLRQNKS